MFGDIDSGLEARINPEEVAWCLLYTRQYHFELWIP
jgi:hypothetical protein